MYSSRFVFIFLIFIEILFFNKNINAQSNQHLMITNFTSKNGLPQNSVNDMIFDSGYLWICTEAGIARYDGIGFTTYNISNTPFILNDHFKFIIPTTKNEKIVFSSNGNILQIKANHLFQIQNKDQRKINPININGGVLSLDMITHFISPNFIKLQQYYSYIPSFLPINQHRFLIKGKRSIFLFNEENKLIPISTNGKKVSYLFSFNDVNYITDEDNLLYKIDVEHGLLVRKYFVGDVTKILNSKSDGQYEVYWKYGEKSAALKLGEKIFLINGTDKNGNLTTDLIVDQTPQNTLIKTILYDHKSKQLFVGTETKGLFVYKKKNIQSYTYEEKDGLGNNNAYYAMSALDSNTILTNYGRMFSIHGAEKELTELAKLNRESFIIDHKHVFWYAVNDTIFNYDFVSKKKSLVFYIDSNYVSTFFESGDTIWVGSAKQIGYIYKNVYHSYFKFERNIFSKPENIIRGPDGNIWFSSCKGVFELVHHQNNLTAVCLIPDICARYLYQYNSKVFVATYGNGYYIFDHGSFKKMPLDENAFLSIAHSFLIDKNNFLWISSNHGLFKTWMTDVLNYLNDTSSKIYYHYFGEDDGLRNIEFNGGCFPNSAVLKSGYFCFPTMDGVVFFDPLTTDNGVQNENIFIDKINVDGTLLDLNRPLIIKPNSENIVFKLSTPYSGNKQNLSIEYKLNGFNKNWIKLREGVFDIGFSNIPSGTYLLQIRKGIGLGSKNYIEKNITFTVSKKFYETYWFISLMFILSVFFVWAFATLYYRNLKRANLILEKKISVRTNELNLLNVELRTNLDKLQASEKSLKQSVNVKNKLISIISHDIITPLRFISMVARNAFNSDSKQLNDIIKDIGGTSQKLYSNAQNILNWIKQQNQQIEVKKSNIAVNPLVEELVEMVREMAFNKENTILNLVSLDDVIKTDKNILSIILHNLISNANKYCSGAKITITSFKENEKYRIAVEDNGNGISENILSRINNIRNNKEIDLSENALNETGLGYIIIFEMLRQIDVDIKIETVLLKGTKVILLFS